MADSIDQKKLEDILVKAIERCFKTLNDGGRDSKKHKNMFKSLSNDLDDLSEKFSDFSASLNKDIKTVTELSKANEKYITAHDKLIASIAKSAANQKQANEDLAKNISKAADELGGSAEFINKKAKAIASDLSKSSSTYASMFDDWHGGMSDLQNQIEKTVEAHKQSLKDEQRLSDEIHRLVVDRENTILERKQKAQEKIEELEKKRIRHPKKEKSKKTNENLDELIAAQKRIIESAEQQVDHEAELRKDQLAAQKVISDNLKKLNDSVAESAANILKSGTAANVFGRELDRAKTKVLDFASSTATLVGGFQLLKEGLFEVADKYRMIADVGMAGAMTQFATTALKLNVTISQLSRIVGENRAAFAKSGLSIQKFGDIADSNRDSLKALGLSNEQAAAAQAKMIGGATAALGSDQKTNSNLLKKSVDDQVKMFKMLSAATGESIDALAVEYESMLKDEQLAKQLQALSGKERQSRAQEMMADMAHYKMLGLSTEQIKTELKLKQASQFRLADRFTGAAQMSVLGNMMGMNKDDTSRFNDLTKSGKKLGKEDQAFVDKYKADLANRVNAEQQNNPNSGKSEAAQSLISAMGEYGKTLFSSGQALAGAQSTGAAQMSIEDANKALIAAGSNDTDRMISAYENQSGLIRDLVSRATVSNDAMAVAGQKTENIRNMLDIVKDSPWWSAGKILLGAAGMLYGTAVLLGKAPPITDLIKGALSKVGGMGGALGKVGGMATKAMPWVAAAGTLAMSAKGIYDATQEKDPEIKKEKLTTSISGTVGTIVGGAIGAAFGGPIGMAIGSMLGDVLGGWVGDCINWVRSNYDKNPYVKKAVDFFKNWTPLGWLYQGVMFIWNNAQAIFDGVKTVANEAWFWIKNFTPFGWVWQGVAFLIENWEGVKNWVAGAADSVMKSVMDTEVFKFLASCVSFVGQKWDAVKTWVKQYTDPIVAVVSKWNPFSWITSAFDSLVDSYYSVKKWVLETKQSLKGAVGGSLDAEDQAALDEINKREAAKKAAPTPASTSGTNFPAATSSSTPASSSAPLPVKTESGQAAKPWTPAGAGPSNTASAAPVGDDYLNSIIEWGGGIAGNISHFKKMDPGLQQRVVAYAAAYFKATGKKLRVNSTFRSPEEEEAVKRQNAEKGIFNGANGTSPHSRGIAVDINPASINAANAAGVSMESFGLWQPLKGVDKEFQHVQPIGTAASTAQANKLGIMSPAQAQAQGTPAMTNFPTASAPAGGQTGAPNMAINTGGNSGAGGFNPGSGPGNSGGSLGGGTSSAYGIGDIVAILKKIAAINTDELAELKNVVSNMKTSKMISEKDQMKTL